jgi:hypothetical protein
VDTTAETPPAPSRHLVSSNLASDGTITNGKKKMNNLKKNEMKIKVFEVSKTMLAKTKFCLVLLFSILVVGCTHTLTKPIDPAVFGDVDKFEYEFLNLIQAEGINFSVIEVTKGENTTLEVEINIVNGINIPTNADKRRTLSQSLANVVKNNLREPNQFEIYRVTYRNRSESAAGFVESRKSDFLKSSEL